MSLNTRFSNCIDFINNMKEVVESDRDRYDDIYMEHSIVLAEIDLMEMELEASYDAEMYDSIMNGNAFRTSKRAQRRKQNKKHHKADRYHGKKLMVMEYKEDHEIKEGLSWLYRDCRCPVGNDVKYSTNAIKAREQEYISSFSEKGELMDKADFLDEAIRFGEREIENLEYEKAFGYLSDRGDTVIEECKRNLSELKDYKKDILRIINTAIR